MKALFALIQSLSVSEQEEARAFIAKRNRRGDAKNLILFDQLCQGQTEHIQQKLYGSKSRNAYHALSKRLQDNLIGFLASKSFETEANDEMRVLKLVLAGRLLFEKEQDKLAWKALKKAETIAKGFDFYTALQEIYQTQLQYAHLKNDAFLKQVLLLSTANTKKVQNELNLQQAYATLKHQLKSNPKNPIQLLQETLNRFDLKLSEHFTYKSLYQFMELLTEAAALSGDYYSITPTIEEAYAYVQEKRSAEKHLYYYFQMRYLLADVYLRNKNFTSCIEMLNEIDHALPEKYRKSFNPKLETLRALAYNYSGDYKEAIRIAEEHAANSENLKLLLVTFRFQQSEIHEAYSLLKEFQKSDQYYERKQGLLWVVKKELIGLLFLIELDKLDLIPNRITSIKKRFSAKVNSSQEEQLHQFLKLASAYYENPKEAETSHFKSRVELAFNWLGFEREDLFAMSFYAWLKSKMENKPLYTATLELVNPTNYSL